MARQRAPGPRATNLVATPLRRELDAILSVRGKDREKALLGSRDLAAIVAIMPAEELFFTLKELDPENLALVLAHARPDHVEFVLDLELWKKDRLRVERVAPWLERLVSCGESPLARWLRTLDLADLVLLLGQVAKVHLADEEHDPLQEAPGRAPLTLDGLYYVSAPEPAENLVRTILAALRAADTDQYYKVLEGLLGAVDCELEERCYEARRKRLAMRGFPEWEEAMEVYARLDAEDASELPFRPGGPANWEPGEEPVAAPRYPLALLGPSPALLARALSKIQDSSALEAFRAELAYLTNKVIVADGLDLDLLDSFHLGLQKVASYVSMGLESLCGCDESEAARILEHCWLQSLFRLGWTRIRRARTRARRLLETGWPQGRKERLLFLDPPLPEMLDGLLRRHPVWPAGDMEGAPYRLFQNLTEVRQAERCVEKADFLGRFLLTVVDLRLGDIQQANLQLDADHLKGTTVFLTCLLNAALGREFRFAPVGRTSVGEGLSLIWEQDRPPRRVRTGLEDSAVEWSKTLFPISEREEGYLREFVAQCFTLLEEEFGHLASDEVPDPRFTRGIWID